jgi:hypothetical protein
MLMVDGPMWALRIVPRRRRIRPRGSEGDNVMPLQGSRLLIQVGSSLPWLDSSAVVIRIGDPTPRKLILFHWMMSQIMGLFPSEGSSCWCPPVSIPLQRPLCPKSRRLPIPSLPLIPPYRLEAEWMLILLQTPNFHLSLLPLWVE